MSSLKPLRLQASQWRFLSKPEAYVDASRTASQDGGSSLVLETTRRQFKTARDILARITRRKPVKGVLLADDVGLGKTTVAALVAWVVASGRKTQDQERCKVRILAPNDAMQRRWADELRRHVAPLKKRGFDVDESRIKIGRVKLYEGRVQVVKHSYVRTSDPADCDLLIIDEAHRAKGENSQFRQKLVGWVEQASRVLILTATPFSIAPTELKHMLELIGANPSVAHAVEAFEKAVVRLHSSMMVGDLQSEAKRLSDTARSTIKPLSRFAIRHGIDELEKSEQKWFGKDDDWVIEVPAANSDEIEMLLRIDRALRLAKRDSPTLQNNRTNDARFHVARRHFEVALGELSKTHGNSETANTQVINHQTAQIQTIRSKVPDAHPKMTSVGAYVMETVNNREKVVLFCDHHATAQELTIHLDQTLARVVAPMSPSVAEWKNAWLKILGEEAVDHEHHRDELLNVFVEWLCADLIRAQVTSWIGEETKSQSQLLRAIRHAKARHPKNLVTVEKAARHLYQAILKNKSCRGVLQWAIQENRLQRIPGANGTSRVLGACEPLGDDPRFMHSGQPDLVLEIFNSPFGPDVLVATDKLSEGIDLHRYCRHLIHYELDPSPIRTVQRNGRIRRVNSWAAVTGQPIQYAYPAFKGTRDQRLVSIMKKRIDNFSLLLGGVKGIDLAVDTETDESWRNAVIEKAKKDLKGVSRMLMAKEPNEVE